MEIINKINLVVMLLFGAAYFYQVIYTLIGIFHPKAKPEPDAKQLGRYAAVVCARNESSVIAELIESLKNQHYPGELLDVYVLADNCTDDTAAKAAAAGAIVYERFNREKVGKGYALDYFFRQLLQTGQQYEGYFIFDADNLVHPDFVAEMNKTYQNHHYDAITGYRNAKNFSENWLSAGYAMQYLKEARFMNHPRSLLNLGCAISGTGYFLASSLVQKMGGWPFFLMTEDIEFSVYCAKEGIQIGYCDGAMVYDEHPTSMKQSFSQRRRWSKGFFQICGRYCFPLLGSCFTNRRSKFTCFDIFMIIIPCITLVFSLMLWIITLAVGAITSPAEQIGTFWLQSGINLVTTLTEFYVGMAVHGALTLACEWNRISDTTWGKLKYLWAYPIYNASYMPITICAMFGKVTWVPILHHSAKELKKKTVCSI